MIRSVHLHSSNMFVSLLNVNLDIFDRRCKLGSPSYWSLFANWRLDRMTCLLSRPQFWYLVSAQWWVGINLSAPECLAWSLSDTRHRYIHTSDICALGPQTHNPYIIGPINACWDGLLYSEVSLDYLWDYFQHLSLVEKFAGVYIVRQTANADDSQPGIVCTNGNCVLPGELIIRYVRD